ncbi:MAG: PorV/PorQ family protein [Candidatus Kryptoniota bacterium]
MNNFLLVEDSTANSRRLHREFIRSFGFRFFVSFAIILLFQASRVRAQGEGIVLATYANDFLSIGVGGRALGMGSAYTAVANDVTAGYWNPAGLSKVEFPEIILMHDERYGGIVSYNYGAAAMKLSKDETVGISAVVLSVSGVPNTLSAGLDINGNPIPAGSANADSLDRLDYSKITFFGETDVALIGSYAKQVSDEFSYGANVKFIRRNIGSAYGTGIGFDVAALYSPFRNFNLGANLQNATTTVVAWTTGTTELATPVLAAGAAYNLIIGQTTILPALDLLFNIDNMRSSTMVHFGPLSADARAGMEVSYKNVIAIRAGYNEVKQFTVGAGIHLPKLMIDYSFARFSDTDALGDTHRISLELILENDKPKP